MIRVKFCSGNSGSNSASNAQETVTLLIPSGSVGAIIGSRGSHIRNISRLAGASIRIHVSLLADQLTIDESFQPPDEMKEESSDDPKSSSDEKNRDEKDTKGIRVRSKVNGQEQFDCLGPNWSPF